MTTCINLRQRFGSQYRITFDPCYDAKHRPQATLDPWNMQIPCEKGVIYPYGGTKLAVEVDYRAPTAKRLAALPYCRLVQDGDHEKTFVFDVADFKAVAAIVQPKRRRTLTPEQRQQRAEQLAMVRPKHLTQGRRCEQRAHFSAKDDVYPVETDLGVNQGAGTPSLNQMVQ